MPEKVNILIGAGGTGRRLGPITYEEVDGNVYKRYPKGTLPLCGHSVLWHLLFALDSGIGAAGCIANKFIFNTTFENLGRVQEAIRGVNKRIRKKFSFVLRNYEQYYKGFVNGLDNQNPTISVHDDVILRSTAVEELLRAFWDQRRSILTFSHTSTIMGKRVDEKLKSTLFIHEVKDIGNVHHTALRLYAPEVKRLIENSERFTRVVKRPGFREFELDVLLATNGKTQAIVRDDLVNINTPEDLLTASRFILQGSNYFSNTSFIDADIEASNVFVDSKCRIGKAKIKDSIVLSGTKIEDDTQLSNTIICSDCIIKSGSILRGSQSNVVVIGNKRMIGGCKSESGHSDGHA